MTIEDGLLRHNARVPRYTSYPTAPHFSALDAAEYTAQLAALPQEGAVSAYIHIPYCREMCWYCGCHTQATRKYAPVEDYVSILQREMRMLADITGPRRINHIHFGGGSPTMLQPDDFSRIMETLATCHSIAKDAEIAIEGDPRAITHDRVMAYARAGVNRISFGVQDVNPRVQEAINRVQPYAVLAQAVDLCRSFGINRINFDLMYGLPLQDEDDVARTVEQSMRLSPDRVALFGYAHVPWMKKHMRLIRDEDLPDARQRLRQFARGEQMLAEAGMQAVGIDHFVKPADDMAEALRARQLVRNFQGYTTDDAVAMLGFGASSIGRLRDGYVQNITPLSAYRKAVLEKTLPVARGCRMTGEDTLRAGIISDLMCYLEVDIAAHLRRAGQDEGRFDDILAGLADLQADELLTVDGRRVCVSPAARPAARIAAARFDSYFAQGAQRHAQAA